MIRPALHLLLTLACIAMPTISSAHLDPLWVIPLYERKAMESGSKEFGQPVFARDGKILIVGDRAGGLQAFDVPTRKKLWERNLGEAIVAQPVALGSDHVVIADVAGRLRLIHIETGKDAWTVPVQNAASFHSPPLVFGDSITILDSNDRLLSTSVKGAFRFEVGARPPQEFSLFKESVPATDGARLFVGLSTGDVKAFDLKTGEQLWRTEVTSRAGHLNDVQAGPIVRGDRLYVGSPRAGLISLNTSTGDISQRIMLNGLTELVSSGTGELYGLTWSGRVVRIALDKEGLATIVWSTDAPGVPQPPALTTESIFYCNGKGLVSVSRRTGKIQDYRTFSEGCDGGVATAPGLLAHMLNDGSLILWRVQKAQ